MNERKLDSSHDIYLEGTHVARTTTLGQVVVQRVTCLLKTFEGECFINEDAGIPWYDDVLGADNNLMKHIAATLKEKILSLENVEKIVKFSLYVSDRNLSGSIQIKASDDTIQTVDLTA